MVQGVGKLDIGEGIGGAQVFNPMPAIQQYGQILAQQQAKREGENNELNKQLAAVKTEGLRNDADRASLTKQYQKAKQQAIDAENETDKIKRPMAIAGARQRFAELQDFVDQSKQQATKENAFAHAYMANPSAFSDEAIDAHRKSYAAAIGTNDIIKDYTQLARNVDPNKIEAQQKAEEQELLKKQTWGNPEIKNMEVAGKKGAFIYNSRQVPIHDLYEKDLHKYDLDNNFQHYIRQTNKDLDWHGDPIGSKATAIKRWVDARGPIAEHSTPIEKQPTEPRESLGEKMQLHAMEREYDINHPTPNQSQINTPTYFEDLAERMRNSVPGSGEELNEQITKNPAYGGKGLKVNTLDPNKLTIEVPNKYKHSTSTDADDQGRIVEKPGYRVVLDKSDPTKFKAGLSSLYSDITGEKITLTKAMTTGGKGHVISNGNKNTSENVRIKLQDGSTGHIPKNKLNEFLKKYPNSKQISE